MSKTDNWETEIEGAYPEGRTPIENSLLKVFQLGARWFRDEIYSHEVKWLRNDITELQEKVEKKDAQLESLRQDLFKAGVLIEDLKHENDTMREFSFDTREKRYTESLRDLGKTQLKRQEYPNEDAWTWALHGFVIGVKEMFGEEDNKVQPLIVTEILKMTLDIMSLSDEEFKKVDRIAFCKSISVFLKTQK